MRAVFFDAGGTLIHIDHARIARAIARVSGRTIPLEAFVEAEYGGRAAVEAAMAGGAAATDSTRWGVHFRGMFDALGLPAAEYERVAPAILEEHRRAHLWCVVLPGTLEALATLRAAGYRVACVSNADGTVETLLEACGLMAHLEFVVDSGKVGVEKPDARIFDLALHRAGVAAAESLYVGDLWPVDVVGARNAGLEPILLDPLGRYAQRGVRTARDLPTLARELVSAREAA